LPNVTGEDAIKAKLRLITAFRSVIAQHCFEQFTVRQDAAHGQTVVICGAGPSLRDTADKWIPRGDQVWGCNSALTWLHNNGYPVTHGFTVDQTAHMLLEWESAPDVEYLIATTVHPHLTDHLVNQGRRVRFFNNYVGIREKPVKWADQYGVEKSMEFEDWMYVSNFAPTLRAGSGLNATTRAIDVAMFMGFKEIIILGADCAMRAKRRCPAGVGHGSPEHLQWLRDDVEMHADGGNALASDATATTFEADIDGRYWLTKPDMAITANWLVQMKQKIETQTDVKVRIIGDTLPKAIMNKPEAWRDRLPNLVDHEGNIIRFYTEHEDATEVPTSERVA
jgi:hypothetical protein